MLNRKCSWAVAASVMAVMPFASTAVFAGGLDGSSNIVCSVIEVTACVEDGSCIEGPAIDAKTGRMRGAGVGDAVSFLVFGTCTTL